ncbi:MAG: hypothetical protein LBT23_06380, partial [Synergistaceae bacterium]|nr:hypothetical protein [Synergistaceae bacterium]
MAFFIFLLNGNLFYGISLSNVLMMTLAFIFSFKLCKYLTQSTIWGYVGAFLFVCGPYLSANRVLRGAFAEYYAMCTLPMVIYYQLRAMANPRIKNWILASSSLSLLLHMHLITWAYTLFFEVIFWFSHTVFMVFDGSPDKKTILGKYRKRTAAFVSPILGCVILSAWYLAPIIFFNKNLMIQASLNPTVQHNFMTTILSVLSIRDMRFVTSLFQNRGRFQLGFLLFAGFAAFLAAGRGKLSSLGLPLRITSLVILLFIIMPVNLFPGRLKIIDIAQFPYRFIAQFQLIATIMSVMALKYFLSSWKDITIIHKKIIGLVVIVFSLTLVTPYLYPDISQSSPDSFPFMFTDEQIYNVDRMSYDAADYLRIPPAGVPEQDEPAVFARQTSGTPNDKTFSVDLKNYGGPEYMIFDVLYYPGLQRIAATLDGQVFHPEISTHWYKDGGGFNIHAMKVSG